MNAEGGATRTREERWRALRGTPPGAPAIDALDCLIGAGPGEIEGIARGTGEDIADLLWWHEISGSLARAHLVRVRRSQREIYRTLVRMGPLTDDEIVLQLGVKKSSVGPRRKELTELGLVQEVEKRTTESGRQSTAWGVVPVADIDQARGAALRKGPRRKHIDSYTLEQKAVIVRYLIRKDDVNALLVEDEERSKAADRARRVARAAQNESDRARRDHNDRIRQAEREASPRLVYLKAVAQLRRASDAVREIGRLIDEGVDNRLLTGPSEMSRDDLTEIRNELHDLIDTAGSAEQQLSRLFIEHDVIDVESYEIDSSRLEPGAP